MKQFKRIISLVIALTMLVSMFSVAMVSTSAAVQTYVLGDVDMNGSVEIMDATRVQRHTAAKAGYVLEEGTIEFAAADVNVDGGVTIFDATLIQRYIAKMNTVGIGETFTFGEPDNPDDPSSEDVSSEDESSEDVSSEDESSDDASSEDESSEDTSSEDESSEDASSEDESSEDESSEDPVEVTEGYYLVGTLNGESLWNNAPLTADRKFAPNPAVDGEYMLDWTFYGGDEIKVVYFDGTEIKTWYKDQADNYKIGADSDKVGECTVYFNPDGNSDWSYTYFTVQPKADPIDPSSEDESSEDASSEDESSEDESSEDPVEVTEGYYLVGTLNGESLWNNAPLTADRKFAPNPGAEGEYMLDWTFYGGDELKVVYFDGTEIKTWYKDQADNYKIGADSDKVGECTVYFNPDGNSDWSYTYFTVQPKADPVDPSSEDESSEDASSEDESSEDASSDDESSDNPDVALAGYYLVGTLNGKNCWFVDATSADRMLKANPGAEGEYMLDWTFYGGDEIKVVYFDGTEIKTWYKDQADNYKIGADSDKVGECTVYFNPDGNSDWSYTYFTVQPKADPVDPSSEDESSEDASSEDESSEDESSEDPVEVTEGYYLVGTLNGESLWNNAPLTADRKFAPNPGAEGEYMLDWTFYGGDEIKVVYFDGTEIKTWYKDQADNYKIGADSDKVGECTVYFNPDGNSDWSYTYFTVQPKADPVDPSSEDESSEDASSEDPVEVTEGYYLVGTLNGESLWNNAPLTADRKFAPNPGAEGEYMLDWTFYGGDEIKVVYFDGTEIKTWYKDQADNYKIGADSDKVGECTVYFNPDGNSDWSYTYFTVQPKADPIDPSSEDESSEDESSEDASSEDESSEDVSSEDESSEEPEKVEAGYYLVGTLNGENCWFVDATSADRMLTANPGAEGEYMLDWTFYGGDEIKVVYFDGTEIKTWYKDQADNYKIGADSDKVGECTVYFNPDGNSDWSYTYFTVQPKADPVDPSSEDESSEDASSEDESSEDVSSEDESSEDASSEDESSEDESSEDPVEVTEGYYLVGTLNGESLWNNAPLTADRKFAPNPGAEGEYMLDWTFYGGDEIKVVYFDGTEIKTWYKDQADNYKIGADSDKVGECTVYFNPDGNSDWSYTYFTVQPKADPVDPSSEDESSEDASSEDASSEDESSEDASSEDESSEDVSSEDPVEVTEGYYLVGTLNGKNCWFVDATSADRMLTANPGAEGEYMLDWTFYGGDEIKVVYFDGTEIKTWYKDQADNYKIGADSDKVGECTVYFNPDGNSDWSYTYFTVQPKADPVDPSSEDESSEDASSEDESSEDASSEDESSEDTSSEDESSEDASSEDESSEDESSEDPVEVTEGYYLVGTLNGESLWNNAPLTADRKFAPNPGAEGEYMLDWTFYGGDEIKVVYFDGTEIKTWYKDQADNYKIGADSDKVGECTVYFNPDGNSDWSYTYFTVQPKADPVDPSSEDESSEDTSSEDESSEDASSEDESSEDVSSEDESSEEPEKVEAGYYLVGTLNGKNCWFVDATSADRMLTANPGAEGEYMLDWTFYGGDEIKVVYFDGTEIKTWYKDQADNYKIGADSDKVGECTVYFNPDGNSDWSYTYFTVQPKADPVDPSSEDESSEDASSEDESSEDASSEDESSEDASSEDASSEDESSEDESSEDPVEVTGGYYLVGTLNGESLWNNAPLTADRKFAPNPGAEGEYMLDWTFYGGDEIKVVYFDGTEIKTWYKDQADNYKIGADSDKVGECTVYFNPDGNSDWSYTYFTVQPKADPVDPSSEDESSEDASSEDESSEDASSEDESSEDASSEDASSEDESSEEPEKVEAGYYLVGTLNGKNCWFVDATSADRMLTANPGAEGEYMLDWTFYGGDEIKVVYFDGTEIKTWYKDQADNYKIGADSDKVGEGTLYFNPDGNSDWSYTYFTVQPKADPVDPSSEDESSEDVSSEDESSEDASSEEPSSEEPTEPVGYTAYCVNSGNYATVSAYAWNEGGSKYAEWPGVAMTKTDMTSPSGAAVWTYTFDTAYGEIIFNDNGKGSQTSDLEFKVGQYYDLATKAWYENLEDIPVPTTYGTGYYLPGSFNSWSQTADEFMTETKGGTTGTVTLTLEANKTYEFKVKSGSSWYGYSTAITGTVTGKTFSTSAGNAKITTKAAGEYVFTFNTSNKQLSVTYPS